MEKIIEEKLFALYRRLRPFLRIVSVYRSHFGCGYWYLMVPTDDSIRYITLIRNENEFRLYHRPGLGFAAVIWMPNTRFLRMPTFREFSQAYGY